MGEVVQGPWKTNTRPESVDQELRKIIQAIADDSDLIIQPSRWPPARSALSGSSPGEPSR